MQIDSINYFDPFMNHQENVEEEWKEEVAPFDELILSWNGARPIVGKYLFYISVKTNEWSPWLLYAQWGSEGQESFNSENASARVYQDALELRAGKKATGFHIRFVSEGNAPIHQIYHLHVYTNGYRTGQRIRNRNDSPIYLQVPGLSQIALPHIRNTSLCSPTSTTAVTRYLANKHIDPIIFAQNVWDKGFDIFGHWVFNVAQASAELGKEWKCWVERLNSFDDIYLRLHQGTPVIVSIRGPLPGGAFNYDQGHLIAVIGFDPSLQKVIAMDPAFSSDDATHVLYDLSDFIQAWSRRGKIAYIFSRKT